MKTVAIIGAGITGLTTAYYLKRAGFSVKLFEVKGRAGGAIRSIRKDGYIAECGPNTILETSPKITKLIQDVGLLSRRMETKPDSKTRFLVRFGRPIAAPNSPIDFLKTDLFSFSAKLAFFREPFISKRRQGDEESVADFVVRRLCPEFLDHAVDAMVGGIYAGDPSKLSLQHAFPKLMKLETLYGSLIKGQIFGARKRTKTHEIAKDRASAFSFDEGLEVLPERISLILGDRVELETRLTGISQTSDGWSLRLLNAGEEVHTEFDAVVYAGSTINLAKLPLELLRDTYFAHQAKATEFFDLNLFSEIRYPPVSSVVLGYRREDVAHPCKGFGMLIPKVENFRILGTLFSSVMFPNRAPEGHLTFTSYIGGERNPNTASLAPEELFTLVHEDLKRLLNIKGLPTFRHHAYFPSAIPQYNVGYGRFLKLMAYIEDRAKGLFFAGNYRGGISLADSIVSGCNMAERVGHFLKSTHTVNA
jgi:oxygen-dependent protoporphyrinogen oxidase